MEPKFKSSSNIIINGVSKTSNFNVASSNKGIDYLKYRLDTEIAATNTQITDVVNNLAITKIINTPFTEEELLAYMVTVDNGIYKINTITWGDELLFVSDMLLPDKEVVWEDGEEPTLVAYKEYARYTSNGASYRYNDFLNGWEMSAGGGGGGGSNSGTMRLTAISPLNANFAPGDAATLSFDFIHSSSAVGFMTVYRNSQQIISRSVNRGRVDINISQHIKIGSNIFKIDVSDGEQTKSITFNITGIAVTLTSLFDDSKISIGQSFSIPYNVSTTALVRKLYVKINGINRPEKTLTTNNGQEIISGLSHGVHNVEMYVIGTFTDAETSYNIQSKVLKFALIYDNGISKNVLISSKFDRLIATRGEILSIDYLVYDPKNQTSIVELYIDNILVNTLTVDRSRKYWNIRTLPTGTHTLKIKSGSVIVEKTITINESDFNLEVVKDDFLKLFLTAEGKTNNDANKSEWVNSFGSPVAVTLNNVNFVSNGWIEDSLRLSKDSSADVQYKPFTEEIPPTGKTIELDFRTRFSLDSSLSLISCISGGIGFQVTAQKATLFGSNVSAVARFKEDEHVRITFVINPTEKFITTFVNGVISGVGFYPAGASFRQLSPVNISLNSGQGSIDIFSIRVYDRALTAQEILENKIAEELDIEEKINLYAFNDIYDDFGNASLEKIGKIIPVLKIEGSELPNAKMDVKPFINVYLEHPFEPTKNFSRTDMKTDINVQGTSSLQYPVKNFKIRLDQGAKKADRVPYQIADNVIPERVFTLKADYMDSSHSHNTGLAKLFDTLYSDNIPPKDFDDRVRTTIYGYPVALFHRLNPTDVWVYKGIYNFNLDKDATTALGLNSSKQWETGNAASVFPATQSFEITFNSDTGAGAFKSDDINGMLSSFEPRYPEVDEFEIFEDENITAEYMMQLVKEKEISLTSDAGLINAIDAATTPEELIILWDSNFSAEPEYVYIEAFRVLIDHYANIRAAVTWVKDNYSSQANFRAQFDDHFNRESAFKYLVSTLVFGLVDNLGKNTMMNTWDGQHWFFNFYDIDTALGLENQGRNIHDYDIEIGDVDAYATADSRLWHGILTHFFSELRTVYSGLRQNILSYQNILEFLKQEQIDKIPQALYNTDAFAKYIGVTTAWLWMAQGDSLEHLKRWLTLRLAFLDSKFQYGDYIDKNIALRINVASYTDAAVDLTPLISQYVGVRFGNVNGGVIFSQRTSELATTKISAPAAAGNGINNMEVWIYGAKWLKSIGSLSKLYPSSVSTDNADKLSELIIGSQSFGYNNDKLTQVSVGSNTYLEKIDITNCSILGTNAGTGSTEVLDLSGAVNMRQVYAKGTQLKGVSLAPGAPIETLKLPATITELVLRDHTNLLPAGVDIAGYTNVTTFRMENVDKIDILGEFLKCTNVQRVRMVGLKYVVFNKILLDNIVNKIWNVSTNSYKLFGLDADGATIDAPVITGTFTVYANADFNLTYYQNIFPGINFNLVVLAEGFNYTIANGQAQISGYTGNAATLIIPESVPVVANGVNYVLGANAQIVPVVILGGTNTIGAAVQNLFIPATVIATSGAPLSSTFKGRIMTAHNTKPAGWNITYENILYGERAFVQVGDFFVRIYNNNTQTELLTMIGSNLEYVTVPRSVEGLTITTIPNNVILGAPRSIYIPNSITNVLSSLALIQFVLTESSEQDGFIIGNNVTYDVSDSLKEYIIYYYKYNGPTLTYNQSWYAFIGIAAIKGAPDYFVNDVAIDDLPYTSVGDAILEIYEPVDYRTFSYNGSTAYTLDSVFVDISEPAGSYVLTIPDKWDDGVHGEKPCNPSSTLFTNTNFPVTSKERIKEIYYYYNGIGNPPGFGQGPWWGGTTDTGFLGNNNFPSRSKFIFYALNMTSINGMQDGDATEVYFSKTALSSVSQYGLAENKLTNVDTIMIKILNSGTTVLGKDKGYLFAYNNISSAIIPYGFSATGDYVFSDNQLTEITIPNSVTIISSGAFQYNQLTNVTIPNSVIDIRDRAFNNNLLSSITFPTNLTSIGQYAFSNNNLTSVTIPDSVLAISNNAFQNNLLESVVIGNGVTSTIASDTFAGNQISSLVIGNSISNIANNAFINQKLTSLILPDSITTIGNATFKNNLLTSIIFGSNIQSIGNEAFSTNKLTSLVIPDTVTSLGSSAFQNNLLTSVTIGSGITSIASGLFQNNLLETIYIPSTITSIGSSAFSTNRLTSVVIPGSVKTIENAAFAGNLLTSVTLEEGITTIGSSAFSNSKLTSITFPSTITSIGSQAFYRPIQPPSPALTITIYATTPPAYSSIFYGYGEITCYVPAASVSAYQAATGWKAMTILPIP